MKIFRFGLIFIVSLVVVSPSVLLQGCNRTSSKTAKQEYDQYRKEENEYNTVLRNAKYEDFEVYVHACSSNSETMRRICDIRLYGNGVKSLEVLRGMKITQLSLCETMVTDLSPLKGQLIEMLDIYGGAMISDLSPLEGMPLQYLCLDDTRVVDLAPISHLPSLSELYVANTRVSDISALEGMYLLALDISGTCVSDLTPLKSVPLTNLVFTPALIEKGMDVIRQLDSLECITARTRTHTLAVDVEPVEFWRRYDAGEFRE